MAEPKLRTSINDVPLANKEILAETARMNKTSLEETENIIKFVGAYIHDTIKRGSMEAVMIPYFGKFKPKHSKLKAMKKAQQGRVNGGDMIYSAIMGRAVVDRRNPEQNSNEDETV